MNTELKIGLALGSGSSRGWSHTGIINELSKLGISPDIVCGTSQRHGIKLYRKRDWKNSGFTIYGTLEHHGTYRQEHRLMRFKNSGDGRHRIWLDVTHT